jgi:hypothetical protein
MSRRRSRPIGSFFPFHTARAFHRAKRAADLAVRKALYDGTLVRQGCARCPRKRNVEAHHDDYSKPLDVIWLCRYHHRQRDAELRHERGQAARLASKLLVASFPAVQRQEIAARMAKGHKLGSPAAQALILDATTALFEAMRAERVSELLLARRLGRSRQLVNQSYSGGIRTLATLAVYADALGYDASVVLQKRAVSAQEQSA